MVFDYLSEVIASMLPLFYSVPFVNASLYSGTLCF